MILESRPQHLLNLLLKTEKTTLNQLMDKTQLTKRQITYDFDKINHFLKTKSLPPIQYKRLKVIQVPGEITKIINDIKINNKRIVLSEEERNLLIYLFLLIRHEPISTAHFTQFLQVSKNTVISDVKKANIEMSASLVRISYTRKNGYFLKGTEFDKRALLMKHLSRLVLSSRGREKIDYVIRSGQNGKSLSEIMSTLHSIEKEFDLQIVEERLELFAYFLLFYFFRQKEKKFVRFHPDEIAVLSQDPMGLVAKRLMELLQLESEEAEVCYFIVQLLGLTLGNPTDLDVDSNLLFSLCEKLVADFESKAFISFENRKEVVESLYKHFKPAYFRMKYRIPIHNPLIQQIKEEHQELYSIVKEILTPVEAVMNVTVPEEEIGFITIHFGALLERPKTNHSKKKKAVIVCPSGISSSLMVKNQLESLFSEISVVEILSLQEFQKDTHKNFDLLFSTVPLNTSETYYLVKPVMTPIEKSHLMNEVYRTLFGMEYVGLSTDDFIQLLREYTNIFDEEGLKTALSKLSFIRKDIGNRRNRPVLHDLLKEDSVQIIEEVGNWEDAIKQAAYPLLRKGVIKQSYIEAMIDSVKTHGPYMIIGPEVAIPHARPEMGVNEVGMSFLKLNHPVYFLNNQKYPVSILFCLAAIDHKTHLKALSQLTKMLSNKENITFLKQLSSVEDFQELVKQFSDS